MFLKTSCKTTRIRNIEFSGVLSEARSTRSSIRVIQMWSTWSELAYNRSMKDIYDEPPILRKPLNKGCIVLSGVPTQPRRDSDTVCKQGPRNKNNGPEVGDWTSGPQTANSRSFESLLLSKLIMRQDDAILVTLSGNSRVSNFYLTAVLVNTAGGQHTAHPR